MTAETAAREALCRTAHSLYQRGLTHGSTGNLSIRLDDGWLMSPTGASLGELDPVRLSRLDADGRHISGDKPTKESFLHLAMYRQRPGSGAVVHLHSTHSVAVSVLAELDPADLLPPLAAYYIMRIGTLPLVPYHPPGDMALADAVGALAGKHHAMLLYDLDPKAFPLLAAIGKNLTAMAARGELDPVVGRDEEIERTLDVLAKRTANNPCLVGQAGVGKTSVVHGLARCIVEGKDVASLDDRRVIEIELPQLLAGTAVRGSLAERLAQIRAEVKKAQGKIVLFFDEIHTLFGPDAGDEAQAELKIALARGELPCIGATTTDEYRRTIDADPALARRFSPIEVVELGPEEAFMAIEQVCPIYERHHAASFSKEAIARAVTWSVRYLPGRALPDKAISILDLAGARGRRRGEREITKERVAEVVSELSGVPEERLLETDGERLLRFEELLAERIVGHKDSLAKIATVLRRNASGFRSRRPVGTFLLLGPTGVGKTETAKAVAECLFYSESAMTRIDMSEYSEGHPIARLLGAPPGYVGHDAGGQLTEAVRRRPYQVVLLDEIEKAHRDVLEGEDEQTIKNQFALFKEKYGDHLTPEMHPLIRNVEGCYLSSSMASDLARKYGTRLHILHISTARELDLFDNTIPLKEKKITSEVCVHHLYFSADDYPVLGNLIKCNPAIKASENRDALFPALLDDRLDIIATDQAPHTREEKAKNYEQSPSGLPLVQHSLNIMLDFHQKNMISMEKIVEKMCHAPADCFGLQDRGYIDEGMYADTAIIDPERVWRVNKANILYKCDWSPLE